MKTVLFVATDCSNPVHSGYDVAREWADKNGKEWADKNGSADIYITSHKIGTRLNIDRTHSDIYAYEVCIDKTVSGMPGAALSTTSL